MLVHRFVIIACTALPLMIGTAAAQNAARYRSWDRNNDGVIARAEWLGTLEAFRELDWNGDGVLSRTELRDLATRAEDEFDATSFARLDRNSDGRLTRGEWLGDRTTFRQVDRNGDNHISRGEFMNSNVGYSDDDVTDFASLDYDRNGRIEQDEWTGSVQSFRRLDVNDDGVLTRRELAASDAIVASTDDFGIRDNDGNGVLSRGEWRGNYANFNRYDSNRDGVISRREYSMVGSGGGGGVTRRLISLDAREAWTNTGIYLNAGDVVTYQAEGNIQMSTNSEDRATPAGSITGRNAQNAPRPDRKAGGLLARVGGSAVEFLGANGSFTARNSGELVLGINDDHFPDNSGEFRVELMIQPR